MLECGGMLFLSAALQRLICFLRQELENATLSASGTVGSCYTFLTRLGRKADLNFLRAMPIKKGSPSLTQLSLRTTYALLLPIYCKVVQSIAVTGLRPALWLTPGANR